MNIDGMALLYRWARNGVPVELRNLSPNLTAWLESAYQLWDEEGPPTDAPPA
jgi:aryl carrier-like protein